MNPRTILIATGQSIPDWSWEVETLLRIHGHLSNREMAEMLGKCERRVSEVCAKLHRAGRVIRWKAGKDRRVALPR